MLIAKWKGRWTTYSVSTDYVKINEFITLEQIMAITRITTKQGALKAINRLETKRLIFRDKNGKDTFYRIVK